MFRDESTIFRPRAAGILSSSEWPAILAIAVGFTAVGFLIAIFILGVGTRTRISTLVATGASDWKRTDTDAQESLRRYRHLFEYSQGLICTHTLNGILLSVNPAA